MSDEERQIYVDMNYFFSKAGKADDNIKNLIAGTCGAGGGLIDYDESWERFFSNIFTPSNLFRILFCDDLDEKCDSVHHAIINMRKCRFHWSPASFRYKMDSSFYNYGLHYLTHTAETYFLEEEPDIELAGILRDAKKFTYGTDAHFYELPMPEEEFIEKYVNNIDGYPVLSQLIIVELFYIHYKLEDDYLKYDLLMELIKRLEELDTNIAYNLCCLLYAYILMAKIMFSRMATEEFTYPADYWPNT